MANVNKNLAPTTEFVNLSIERYNDLISELLAYRNAIKLSKQWNNNIVVTFDLQIPVVRERVTVQFYEDFSHEFKLLPAFDWFLGSTTIADAKSREELVDAEETHAVQD